MTTWKLKKYLKQIRMKQKIKKWGLEFKRKKQREQWYTLTVRREKRRGEKKNDRQWKFNIISYQMPLLMEKKMMGNLKRRRKARFGHQTTRNVLFEWHRSHPHGCTFDTHASNFSTLKINKQCKKIIIKMPPITLPISEIPR